MAFLTDDEVAALVTAPDTTTWLGRRDRTLLLVATQTGLLNSELTGLRRQDVTLERGPHIRCTGKGRKARATPLRPDVAAALADWLAHQPGALPDPLFPSARGRRLSADALQRLVTRHRRAAGRTEIDGVGFRVHTQGAPRRVELALVHPPSCGPIPPDSCACASSDGCATPLPRR